MLKIKGTGLNIAILGTLLSSVPFMTIINLVFFISFYFQVEIHIKYLVKFVDKKRFFMYNIVGR